MKVALVHEYLNQLGGAERVLQNFLEIWPEATVHLLLYDKENTHGEFEFAQKRVSIINSLPFAHQHHRLFVILMSKAIENFDFSEFDVVLSDASSFAKGVKTDKLHICYCHAPTRYLWTVPEYLDNQKYPLLLKFFGRKYLRWLKKWDYRAAQRPNFYIANSKNIQNQIKEYYNRDSIVIFPPVDADKFFPDGEKQNYFFTVSRLEPVKKIHLIIEAFNQMGLSLKIAGTGSIEGQLKALAKPNIEFVGRVSDERLRRYYSEAKAFVFAAEEDAGIALLEAQACGTPVLAYGKGGALEAVLGGVTGEFFDEQNAESLKQVLKRFDSGKYNPVTIRQHAQKFDKKIFKKKIKSFVEEKHKTIDQRIFSKRNFHGVKGIIFIDDKMLVYRRDNKTDNFPLQIDLPGGGKEADETPFETFQRESKEEFGVQIEKSDISYAKQYMSAMDPTKESYFFVTRPLNVDRKDIIFGNEGLEFLLVKPEEYLKFGDAIKRHQDKVKEYFNSLEKA
ncbi:MAG: glycosyltransferase [Candidatus Doudnabacteria bacterium]